MSKANDVQKARSKAGRVLGSSLCNLVRFQLDNVKIQYLQYSFIGGLITKDKVHISVDDGRGYDHKTDTITFDDKDPESYVVIHEATHAIIDYAHDGMLITRGTHEASAYLAETVYALATTGSVNSLDIPYLTKPVADLARQVLANNQAAKPTFFHCNPSSVDYIKAILGQHMDIARTDRMNGVKGA